MLCAELGHEVVEATPGLTLAVEQIVEAFLTVHDVGIAADIDASAAAAGREPSEDWFEPLTWAMYQVGRKYSAPEYLLAVNVLHRTARDIARFLTWHDIWLTSTLAEPPVPLGTFASPSDNPLAGWHRTLPFAPLTPICNFTGQPAMSVPLFWNDDSLPVGTHFIGRFGDEATLFRLAAQLEQARPWADKRPPVSA